MAWHGPWRQRALVSLLHFSLGNLPLSLLTDPPSVDPSQPPAFATAHSFPVSISRQLTGQSSDLSEHLPELVGKSFSQSDDGFETIVPSQNLSRGSKSASAAAAEPTGGALTVEPLLADQQPPLSQVDGQEGLQEYHASSEAPTPSSSTSSNEQKTVQQAEDGEVQHEGDMQYWLVPPATHQHHRKMEMPHLEKLEEREEEDEAQEFQAHAGGDADEGQQHGRKEAVTEAGYWGSPVKAAHKQWQEDIEYPGSPKEQHGFQQQQQQQHLRHVMQEDSCGWGSFSQDAGSNPSSVSLGPVRPRFSSFKEISEKISSLDGVVQQPAPWGSASQGGTPATAAAGTSEEVEPSLSIAAVLGAGDLPPESLDAGDELGGMDFTIAAAPDVSIRRVSSRGSRRSSRNIIDQVRWIASSGVGGQAKKPLYTWWNRSNAQCVGARRCVRDSEGRLIPFYHYVPAEYF